MMLISNYYNSEKILYQAKKAETNFFLIVITLKIKGVDISDQNITYYS